MSRTRNFSSIAAKKRSIGRRSSKGGVEAGGAGKAGGGGDKIANDTQKEKESGLIANKLNLSSISDKVI